jgi:hypothetical protein
MGDKHMFFKAEACHHAMIFKAIDYVLAFQRFGQKRFVI